MRLAVDAALLPGATERLLERTATHTRTAAAAQRRLFACGSTIRSTRR
jgi:hypothetical protein